MMNTEIINALVDFDIITRQDVRTIQFVEDMKGGDVSLTEDEEKTLVLYFSFLRDGSTCLVLDQNLLKRWIRKWKGLKDTRDALLSEKDRQAVDKLEIYFKSFFDGLETLSDRLALFKDGFPIYFDSHKKMVFAQKFHWARNTIRAAIQRHFTSLEDPMSVDEALFEQIQEKYAKNDFCLKKAQVEAVVKGQSRSLVITGGPGTGKTTVVFYLLLELLLKDEFRNHSIYLTAPSGKAADRLKESITDCCAHLEKDEPNGALEKIRKAESSTIHRLLKYNPQTNAFSYNEGNPFPENSIFVIDEASMIGVSLFAKLLSAIPKGARIYILGDKDQLPSVDAGAAFEEMLKIHEVPLVELCESNRFNSSSEVGKVALALQQNRDCDLDAQLPVWQAFASLSNVSTAEAGADNLRLISYESDLAQEGKQSALTEALQHWIETFYHPCSELAALDLSEEDLPRLRDGVADEGRMAQLSFIWEWAKRARILSAVREGIYGVENLNRLINGKLNAGHTGPYHGEFLMITRNQSTLQLFNGDFGVVIMVLAEDGNRVPYFMLEKNGGFVFYLLDLIPRDAYESAFAMTVHQAQGSGYDHILFFLPESTLSPIATRQILYTGITRIQKGVLTIIGSETIFKACCKNRINRQTGLQSKNKSFNHQAQAPKWSSTFTSGAEPNNINELAH